jgi:hypothetical protein
VVQRIVIEMRTATGSTQQARNYRIGRHPQRLVEQAAVHFPHGDSTPVQIALARSRPTEQEM